jgi:hypothetical protein
MLSSAFLKQQNCVLPLLGRLGGDLSPGSYHECAMYVLSSSLNPLHNTYKVKKKVKLSRYTPWRHMGGEEVQLLLILNLGTRWGWVVSVTPRPRFTPGGRTPGTHWIGGWVGPRAGLDAETKRKIICPCRGSNLDRPIVQPVIRHYTAWATPAPTILKQIWELC